VANPRHDAQMIQSLRFQMFVCGHPPRLPDYSRNRGGGVRNVGSEQVTAT
jgi:hypothetical protein